MLCEAFSLGFWMPWQREIGRFQLLVVVSLILRKHKRELGMLGAKRLKSES